MRVVNTYEIYFSRLLSPKRSVTHHVLFLQPTVNFPKRAYSKTSQCGKELVLTLVLGLQSLICGRLKHIVVL